MKLSRLTSTLLVAFGVWSWVIWPRFALAIWQDDRSWHHGSATSFLWVHALIVVASVAFGTGIGVLGIRGWLARRSPDGRSR
ncbi:MAG TPA: hypothetical protein VGN37_08865 [Actinocatenispora sp.]